MSEKEQENSNETAVAILTCSISYNLCWPLFQNQAAETMNHLKQVSYGRFVYVCLQWVIVVSVHVCILAYICSLLQKNERQIVKCMVCNVQLSLPDTHFRMRRPT